MTYNLFEYLDWKDEPAFSAWRMSLDTQQRARLDSKVNMLRTAGADLASGLLAGIKGFGHLRKLKVQGNVKLRPRLCEGPIRHGSEFSLLIGAVEINFKTVPSNADSVADSRRSEIISNPQDRRRHYGS